MAPHPATAAFFEEAIALGGDPKSVANWMAGDLAARLNEDRTSLASSKVTPRHLADLAKLLGARVIGSPGAKAALDAAYRTGDSIESIVERDGLRQVSDASALEAGIDKVIEENPGPVEQFPSGKEGALNALIGPVMRATNQSANVQ